MDGNVMQSNNALIEVEGRSKAKVFISYSRKDMAFADRLEAVLKARSFEPLIDRTEIYAFEEWWKRIEALITRADTVVFVLSPDAVASDVALRELTDWRWMLDCEDSPWYPTMRLFRQKKGEDWAEVIARVANELKAVAQGDATQLTPFKVECERRAAEAAAIMAAEAAHVAASAATPAQTIAPGQALALAEQKRRQGFLAEADDLARRAASAQPENAEAAHTLGIIAHQSSKLGEAIDHIRRAIAIKPDVALYHSNLGEMYRLAGRIDDAIGRASPSPAHPRSSAASPIAESSPG
jgi:tetratricopeptide (TPR) repeat protein